MIPISTPVNSLNSAVTAEQVRWIADFNVMMTLGDGLTVSALDLARIEGESIWRAEVVYSATGKPAGELHIDPSTGQNVTWHPCKCLE
jgi:hypothetical protein